MNASQLNFLQWILQCKRPHGSKGLDTFVDSLFASYEHEVYRNPAGAPLAVVITVGSSRTLFSCHLDTVHREDGFQAVTHDETKNMLRLAEREPAQEKFVQDEIFPTRGEVKTKVVYSGNWGKFKPSYGCLGADDGAGIWLMLEMIDAGVPGVFCFHFGEESGGIGSSGMVTHHSDFLSQFDRAVAFDRRGLTSVITHQGFGRCCSDLFADALAQSLSQDGLDMWPDSTGIFTDTANYTDLIGECTNVSCGYDAEHTDSETLNVTFLSVLRDVLMKVDWENLPTDRQPGEEEAPAYGAYGSYKYGGVYDSSFAGSYTLDDLEDLSRMKYRDLVDWVRMNKHDPEYIADVLYEALADRLPPAGTTEPFCEEDDWV